MDKAIINPRRLQWCLDSFDLSLEELAGKLGISIKTLETIWENKPSVSIKQINKLAIFFNRSMLFFINPNAVKEEKILSPQFRTINNRRPIHSRTIRILIEQAEKHRKIYLSLLEDIEEEIITYWFPEEIDFENLNIPDKAKSIREWLNLDNSLSFKELREKVENKGILVILSNSFSGPWKIDKKNPVRGFSLYYDVLPIIVIKKQSDGAQAFTLFHELVHLLLHKNSVLDYEEDYRSEEGIEKEANRVAGNILIPDNFLSQIDIQQLKSLGVDQIDNYLDCFSRQWCVSNEAILVRLLHKYFINNSFYADYKSFKEYLFRQKEKIIEDFPKNNVVRTYRHREPLNIFGKNYVNTVLEAYQSQHITLAKASTYLDNIKVKDVHKLVEYVV